VKILKGQGSFEIYETPEELRVQLLKIERVGRTCYQSEREPITMETAIKFSRMLVSRHHYPLWNFGFMTVKFVHCSRGFTHELVRHRLAAYAQESTRYVDYSGGDEPDLKHFELKCIVPPHHDENEKITLDDGRIMTCLEMLGETERFYRGLRSAGWLPDAARQLLPTAIKADIWIETNFTEWRHIFEMRTQLAAHWEIRAVMCALLEAVQKIIPVIFDDFVLAGTDKNGLRYYELAKQS